MAAAFANEFALFNATDFQCLIASLNEWASNQEHQMSENRGQLMVVGGELEQLRNNFALMESAIQRFQQVGSQAVAELDMHMGAFRQEFVFNRAEQAAAAEAVGAFRQELVLGRAEQAAAAEAFKEELRVLTGQLQAKFLEVEAAQQKLRHQDTEALKVELRTLVAQLEARFLTVETTFGDLAARPPAPATAAGQDPWWRRSAGASQAPWPGGAGAANQPATRRTNFDLATEDTASDEPTQAGAGPPGFSGPQGWQPNWDSTRQSGRPESHSSEFKVDIRNWKSAPLDLDVKPEGFLAWRDRALVLLSGNRLDVRRLLQWAEKSSEPLDAAAERRGAQASGLVDDVATVSFALHGA